MRSEQGQRRLDDSADWPPPRRRRPLRARRRAAPRASAPASSAPTSCELTGKGAPAKVWYFEYRDNAAMDTAYKPYTDGTFTAGDCTAKSQKMDYSQTAQGKKLPGGLLHCYASEQGETYYAWTHDALHILSFAGDPDLSFPKMRKWWEKAGPYRET